MKQNKTKFIIKICVSLLLTSCGIRFNNPYFAPSTLTSSSFLGAVFGQTSEKSYQQSYGFGTPSQTILVGEKLVVSDTLQNRILIYNQIPKSFPSQPDLILGQPDLINHAQNAGDSSGLGISVPRANTLNFQGGIASDGTRLVVADAGNHRVLIWNTFPTIPQQEANIVLGQPDFTSRTSGCSGRMSSPRGVWIDNNTLYVADTSNYRVLVYTPIPTTSGTSPTYVIGQNDAATCSLASASATAIPLPIGIYSQGGKLFVSNTNRVSVFSLPISGNLPTSVLALGQSSTSANATVSPPNSSSLIFPGFIGGDGTKLVVCDTRNNRVLIWNTVPGSSGVASDIVLGQPDFTSNMRNQGGVSAKSMSFDKASGTTTGGCGVYFDGTRLIISDPFNHRILIWNSIPTTSWTAADQVVGQPNFSSSFLGGASDGSQTLTFPNQILIAGGTLIAASSYVNLGQGVVDNRILIWNTIPVPNPNHLLSSNPSIVLGQADLQTSQTNAFATDATSVTDKDLYSPSGATWDGSKFYVSDSGNSRILIYAGIPTLSAQAPTGVIGQTNFTTRTSGVTSTKLNTPGQLASTSNYLFVTDSNNSRVLIFNPPPSATSFGASASLVLGQSSMTTGTTNAGTTPGANTLSAPFGIATDGSHFIVSDRLNHRVLIWNSIPTQNQQAADLVLGQSDFVSVSSNRGSSTPTASTLNSPRGVWSDGSRLLVVDSGNHRVLQWNTFPTQNGVAADAVYGQNDFISNTSSNGAISGSNLYLPMSALIYQSWLYIADGFNHRLLVIPSK